MSWPFRKARKPKPMTEDQRNQAYTEQHWHTHLPGWLQAKQQQGREITYRGTNTKLMRFIIDSLVVWHIPYKIIKHGAGLMTLTTNDVSGPCLCCGAKDVTICRLAK